MREQQYGIARASDDTRDIRRLSGPEPDSRQFEALSVDLKPGSCVFENLNTLRGECSRHIAVVIVIAEDCEDTVRCRQRCKQLGDWSDKCAIAPGDVIAAEHDQ